MEKQFLVKICIAALTTVFCFGYAAAWDEVGHKLTAHIAWQRMSPEVREQAFKILLKAPEDSDLSVPYDFYNSRSEAVKKLELFMYASIWADVIKDRKFEVRNKTYSRFNWHFSDIFWKQEDGKAVVLKDFNGDGGLAISKLYDFEKALRNPEATAAEKAIALAWFLHVGGDVHNPLHNASRVTEVELKGDQGGNLVKLEPKVENKFQLNLHSYWDSIIGRVKPRKRDACDTDYLAPIARKIAKKYRFSKMRNQLKLYDYKAWNKEGFELLPQVVYTPDISRSQMPSKKYRKRAFRTAEKQIALAGYRLGETLNRIFATELKKISSVTPCKVIRKVLYPVSKIPKPNQRMRIALLDTCPPNPGMVARPMISLTKGDVSSMRVYDVVKVFENEKEARKYAKENNITDAKYN